MRPRLLTSRLFVPLQKKVVPCVWYTRMASTKAQQQSWLAPTASTSVPVLKVYNSLTRSKTEMIPSQGKLFTWYNCGPTVYDDSHMGHARNYVTQDFIRRIMRDYFGFDIHFVMNITDIDDKACPRSFRY